MSELTVLLPFALQEGELRYIHIEDDPQFQIHTVLTLETSLLVQQCNKHRMLTVFPVLY